MKKRLIVSKLLLTALIILPLSGRAAARSEGCPAQVCQYLPFVRTASPVQVLSQTRIGAKTGRLRVVGEITAARQQPLSNVGLEVRVYDEFQQIMAVQPGHPVLKATLPGQPNPFDIQVSALMEGSVSDQARIEVAATGWEVNSPVTYRPVEAKVTRVEPDPQLTVFTQVEIELQNEEDFPLWDVWVSAWSPTAQGGGIYAVSPATFLAPGEVITCTMKLYATDPPIHVAAQGVQQGVAILP